MDQVDTQEVLDELNSHGAEAAQVSTFSMWVKGGEVRVELFDHGPHAGATRFSAQAFTPDMPEGERSVNSKGLTIGNPGRDFREALDNLHWEIFRSAT